MINGINAFLRIIQLCLKINDQISGIEKWVKFQQIKFVFLINLQISILKVKIH